MAIQFLNNPKVGDNVKIEIGDSADLQIYHDGSNSFIRENGTGVLTIDTNGSEIQFNKGTSDYMLRLITDAGVKAYYDNSLKLETTSTGVSVSGSLISEINASGNNVISTFKNANTTSGNRSAIKVEQQVNATGSYSAFLGSTIDGKLFLSNDSITANHLLIDTSGNSTFAGEVEVINAGGLITGRSSSSSSTNSSLRFMGGAYTGNKATAILYDGVSGENQLYLGGGTGAGEPATNIRFHTGSAGATGAGTERMRIKSTGQVQFNAYGLENFTGNVAYQLAVDSSGNIIEIGASDLPGGPYLPLAGGTLTGSLTVKAKGGQLGSTGYYVNSQFSDVIGGANVGVIIGHNDTTNGLGAVAGINGLAFLTYGTAWAERMRIIGSNGNVGINNSSPLFKLTVSHSDEDGLMLKTANTSNSLLNFADSDDNDVGQINYDHNTNHMGFRVNAGEKMRIDSSGNVGIGTTSPADVLGINVPSGTTKGIYFQDSGTTNYGTILQYVEATNLFQIKQEENGVQTGILTIKRADGNVGIGTTAPQQLLHISNSSGSFAAEAVLRGSTSTGTPKSEIAFKRFTSGDGATMVLRTSNSSGTIQDVLTLDTSKNATFAGAITLSGKVSGVTAGTANTDAVNFQQLTDAVTGVLVYQGVWDASGTGGGSPDLTAGDRKVPGYYWIVNVDGQAAPNGTGTTPNEWVTGDWCVFSDQDTDAWQKIDNTNILTGAGTGGTIAGWAGSGTSVTLGNTPITFAGTVLTTSGDINIGNSASLYLGDSGSATTGKAVFGAGNDLELYSNGTDGYVVATVDDLVLQSADDIFIYTQGGEDAIIAKGNAAVELYYDNAKKFETTSTGVSVTSQIIVKNPTGGNSQILLEDNSGSTQNASITFDQAGENQLYITTGYDSSSDLNRIYFQPGGETAMTIRGGSNASGNAGNVGIGTTAPLARLHLSDTTGGTIYIQDSDGTATYNVTSISNGGNNLTLDTRSSTGTFVSTDYQIAKNASGADYHRWFTQGSERVRLNSAGNVGIGTTGPQQKLDTPNIIIGGSSIAASYRANATLMDNLGGVARFYSLGPNASTGGSYQFNSLSSNVTAGSGTILTLANNGNATFAGDVSVEDNLYLTDAGTTRAKIQLNASDRDDLDIKAVSLGSNMKFFTVDTERMRITSVGAIGIDNTSPNSFNASGTTSASLVIGKGTSGVSPQLTLWQGNSAQATINFASANTGTGQYEGRIRYTRDTGIMDFRTNGVANVLVLNATGNATFAGNVTANGVYSAGQSAIIYKAQRNGGAVASDWSYDDATTDMSLGTSTSHSFSIKTANTRALTIDSSQNSTFAGKVIVGKDSSNALEVFSSGDTEIGFSYATKGNIYAKIIGDITTASPLGGELAFQTATGGTLTERMRIDSAGDVGIGTTDPGHKLTVGGLSNYDGIEVKGTGASRPEIKWSNANQGNLGNIYGTESNALVIATGSSGTTALTLDSSQNATFAGGVKATRFQGSTYPSNSILGSTTDATTTTIVAGSTANLVTSIDLAGSGATNPKTIIFKTLSAERMRIDSAGNVGIGSTSPSSFTSRKLVVAGVTQMSGFYNTNNLFEHVTGTLTFSDGTENQNADLRFGNVVFWGYIKVEITGTYSHQLATGKLTKIYSVGVNQNNSISQSVSRVSDSVGAIADNIALGEFFWDSTNSQYAIKISHIVGTGNGFTVKVTAFSHQGLANNLVSSISFSSVYIATALSKNYINFLDNVGIGTTSPASLSANTFNLSLNSSRTDLSSGLFLQANGSTKATFYWDTAGLNIQNSSGDTKFSAGGSERMRITSAGNVGIGTTAPAYKLEVSGGAISIKGNAPGNSLRFDSLVSGTATSRNALYVDTSNVFQIGNTNYASNNITGNTTFAGGVTINNSSGETLLLTKSTTEPSVRFQGDTNKDFVLTVSGETFTITQNDGVTDILILDHDTKNATFGGNITVGGGQILTPSGVNLALNPNTGVVNVGGVIRASGTANSYFTGNVGIGTTNPTQKLTVGGGAILQEGPTGGGNNTFQTWQYGTDTNYKLLLKQNVGGGIVKHIFDLTNSGTAYNNILVLDRGKVGIGTASPSEALEVSGTIKGTKLGMDQSGSSQSDLSAPSGFIDVVIGTTAYIIPYYTPE